jgi:hypothetical protein
MGIGISRMSYILISYKPNGEHACRCCVVGRWDSNCEVILYDSKEQLEAKIKPFKGLEEDGDYTFAVVQDGELIRDFGDYQTRYSDEEWSKE